MTEVVTIEDKVEILIVHDLQFLVISNPKS